MATSSETASRFGKWLGAVRRWAGKPRPAPPPSRSIGLALGGGFARGIAHVGVLRVFEKYQVPVAYIGRSEEHTPELQSPMYLVCRLLLEKKKTKTPDRKQLQHTTIYT